MSKIFNLFPNQIVGHDVPLHLKLGTEFLVLLVTLMAFLSVLSAAGIVGLGHMTHSWTSGLENSVTIEVPQQSSNEESVNRLILSLKKIDGVSKVERLGQKKMQEMLDPWLGGITGLWEDLPLPALITVTLSERDEGKIDKIGETVRRVLPDATMDAHEEWLGDLVKLANSLRFVSLAIFCLMMLVTAVVVAGAVRSRMAIHHRELELLHIMGASDSYITWQFVRYIMIQSLKGVVFGIVLGGLTIGVLGVVSRNGSDLLPHIDFDLVEMAVFAAVPAHKTIP